MGRKKRDDEIESVDMADDLEMESDPEPLGPVSFPLPAPAPVVAAPAAAPSVSVVHMGVWQTVRRYRRDQVRGFEAEIRRAGNRLRSIVEWDQAYREFLDRPVR